MDIPPYLIYYDVIVDKLSLESGQNAPLDIECSHTLQWVGDNVADGTLAAGESEFLSLKLYSKS